MCEATEILALSVGFPLHNLLMAEGRCCHERLRRRQRLCFNCRAVYFADHRRCGFRRVL